MQKKPQYTRHRSLQTSCFGVRFDENDLLRIASIIRDAVASGEAQLEIEMVSGDGRETITSEDPQVFTSREIPRVVQSVEIRLRDFLESMSCRVDLDTRSDKGAVLRVEGAERERVTALYWELERELSARRVPIAWLGKAARSFAFAIALSIVLAASVYSIFDVSIRLMSAAAPGFAESMARSVLVTIGWIAIALMFFVGPTAALRLQQWFPGVVFSGQLGDPYQARRRQLYWLVTLVLVPIIVNVLAMLLGEAFGIPTGTPAVVIG